MSHQHKDIHSVLASLFRRKETGIATLERTFLIAGLGNPGRQYIKNRHNVGFMLADRLANRLGVSFSRVESQALVTKSHYQGARMILVKPQTYMNESGRAIGSLVRFYKLPLANLLVSYDDVDLPLSTLRLRPSGGSAGHKGVKSIISRLGSETFPRLRIGVDRPPGRMDAAAYVLQDFSPGEFEVLNDVLDRAVDAVLVYVHEGLENAMNLYNGVIPGANGN